MLHPYNLNNPTNSNKSSKANIITFITLLKDSNNPTITLQFNPSLLPQSKTAYP